MHINDFPNEILDKILGFAAETNGRDGVTFTYGIGQAPQPYVKAKIQRYVRGQRPPDIIRWDAASPLRQACSRWHDWALSYSMKDIYVKRWRGNERWANLPQRQTQYPLYEIAEERTGPAVYKDPFAALRKLAAFFRAYPAVAAYVRRIWFNDFHTAEADADIASVIRSCSRLVSASVPSTLTRRLHPRELQRLLISEETGNALHSLELQAADLTDAQCEDRRNVVNLGSLAHVDFSRLRRLKFFGDSTRLPITDADLTAIARSATGLEEFHITSLSSITIQGVMAIVEASHSTLRVLEHSPRSQDGFFHPHPGYLPDSDHHICDILASCPRLESLSISVPSMCSALFSNPNVRWRGDCQVRAAHLCPTNAATPYTSLSALLATARRLIESHSTAFRPTPLYIELFFAELIFEPGFSLVHGAFESLLNAPPSFAAPLSWPAGREQSRKGPYGSTGLYGKDDDALLMAEGDEVFEKVQEAEFLRGVQQGWVVVE